MNEFEWKIEEPSFTPKSSEWFWALGIAALAMIVFAIILKNYLLIIIVALLAFIVYHGRNTTSDMLNVGLGDEGLRIGKKLYSYEELESFWIFPAAPGIQNPELALRRKNRFAPLLTVPFYEADEEKIKSIIGGHLPEKEETESLVDLLRKKWF